MLQLIKTTHIRLNSVSALLQTRGGSVVLLKKYIFIHTTMCTIQLQLKYFVHKETNTSLTKKMCLIVSQSLLIVVLNDIIKADMFHITESRGIKFELTQLKLI